MPGFLRAAAAALACLLAGCAGSGAPAATCPQPRDTVSAPADVLARQNPLAAGHATLQAAAQLFRGEQCTYCHGRAGDGQGPLQYQPPPRNFTCTATMDALPDGQLFWIIRNGSPGTAMPPHPGLSEEQTWQLVHFLRALAHPER